MTHTTTDAAEARARLDKLETRDVHTGYDEGGNFVYEEYVRLADVRELLATAEAASGAGEREEWQEKAEEIANACGMVRHSFVSAVDRDNVLRDAASHLHFIASLPPATDPAKETVAFVQEWLMSSDHEPTQWDRDFAAAIDARCKRQPTDADIQAMAQRFCATPLPESVCADLVANLPMAGRTGTNLLTVDEAATMLRAALAAAPTIPATGHAATEGEGA